VLATGALVLASDVAHAGPPPTEAEIKQARDRFGEARKLEDQGRWAEALTLLQRVGEVKMSPQVRFHIALCMENVGLWTQALDGYQQAITEAATTAPDVVKEATEHARKLETNIPTVSITVQGASPGDELYLDRRRIPLDDSPLPIRADPGPHVAEARRGGVLLAREYFALVAKATLRVELRVGSVAADPGQPVDPSAKPPDPGAKPPDPGTPDPSAKPPDPSAKPPDPSAKPPDPVVKPPDPPPVEPPRADGRVQRGLGWTAVGLGGASAILTGVFVGLRADAMDRLDLACPTHTQCAPSVAGIVSDGKRDALLVNVFGVGAGVLMAAGVVLLVTAPSAPPPATSPGRAPAIAPAALLRSLEVHATAGGLSMRGTF
jgi:hypothetical protein